MARALALLEAQERGPGAPRQAPEPAAVAPAAAGDAGDCEAAGMEAETRLVAAHVEGLLAGMQ